MEKNSKDDFYAVVSAIARFIETADNDRAPIKNEKDIEENVLIKN
jgi:hypothetical protein